ncbi:MAG: hypothetical protein A3F16_00440 [Deltaproteobacteria bacterium RIFCSPHIGHO2_12_FULL_43_9]|nr:MAG: hypothetical protein A3F16_00440 [Deltaproteobacteria bacterium RIFCSPHIGHO2_12_FULL_43_9]
MFKRYYSDQLNSLVKAKEVLVLYGPRQAGKTTLVEHFLKAFAGKYRFVTGEDAQIREVLESENIGTLKKFSEGYELLVIDEAQYIENIGLCLKLFVDHIHDLKLLATGSASFELANKIGEPLTGRKTTRVLFPVAQLELALSLSEYDIKQNLHEYLIFGSYPAVLSRKTQKEKIEYLHELVGSYLLKDILAIEKLKNSKILLQLVRLLAFQIGKEVSYSELGKQLGVDYKTIALYLDLLEKTFVIFSLSGFSRNLRKEISKSQRYYFYDNGIRNALISNFNRIDLRDDIGELWENFIMVERKKRSEYLRDHSQRYFWRTYDKKEIDLIEESGGKICAYELKWKSDKRPRAFNEFLKAYPGSEAKIIHQDNYFDFVART